MCLCVPAFAAPTLQIRARSQLEVTVDRVRDGLTVRGRLVDGVTGAAIGGRTVAISVHPVEPGTPGFFEYAEPSGSVGEFRWHVPLPLGSYRLRLYAGGDEDYAAAPPFEQVIDLKKSTPQLRVSGPDRVSLSSESVSLRVEVSDPDSIAGPNDAAVALMLDDVTLARLTVAGSTEHTMSVAALRRGRGRVTLKAVFAGDTVRNPAEASHSFMLTTPTKITLHAAAEELAWDGVVALGGKLDYTLGTPQGLGAQTVVFYRADQRLGETQTEPDGTYQWSLHGGGFATGPILIEARFEPGDAFEPARSTVVSVVALAPTPRSPLLYLVPLAMLLAVGSWPLVRRRWANRRRQRDEMPRRQRRPAPAGQAVTDGRRGLLSRLGAATDHALGGRVRGQNGHGLRATVTIRAPGAEWTVECDEAGRFLLDQLPAAELQIEVSATAHLPEQFVRSLPHHGELRELEIALTPVRTRILALFESVVASWAEVDVTAEVGLRTPRELFELVRRRRLVLSGSDELVALTTLVERAYFGREAAALEHLVEAEARAEALRLVSGA